MTMSFILRTSSVCGFLLASLLVDVHAQDVPPSPSTAKQTDSSDRTALTADPLPLRAADTSSPRDTLRGFMADYERVVAEWKQRGRIETADGYRAYSRAVSALDFSTTPQGDSRVIRTERVLMLREILDRVEIPSDDQIPGDDDVAELKKWTLPNTSLVIERVERGPRAGDFLVSKHSVQRLDRYYRMVKHLPYRANAKSSIYEAYQQSKNTEAFREQQIRSRLSPVDMSCPRSTLLGFLESVNLAYEIVMKADADFKAIPPTITVREAREQERKAQEFIDRAVATLNLTNVPEALREDVGIESVLQLKEVIDRTSMPLIDSIPDEATAAEEKERLNRNMSGEAVAVRWRYPNTPIEIVETLEGDNQGSFQFSARTVAQLDETYRKVREVPYRRDLARIAVDHPSPNVSTGFYEYYISTPGSLIPRSTALGRIVDQLPDEFKTVHYDQTVWQWMGLSIVVLLVAMTSLLIRFVFRRLARRVRPPANRWIRILSPIAILFLVFVAIDVIDDGLNLTGVPLSVVSTCGQAIVVTLTAFIGLCLCRTIADTIIAIPRIPDESIDASLLRLGSRVLGGLMFAWILTSGLNHVGINMIPLLAGLGVGGLAVALAARPTIESVIGSFMIFWDKPYQVGQRIKVSGHDGTVESIGLRSTKIRLLNGHQTSIPNEKMASVEIENIGRRPYIRRTLDVTITYDTSPQKINEAIEILQEILAVPAHSTSGVENTNGSRERQTHPNDAINNPEFPPRVFFSDLNADSLNLLVVYWYHPADYWTYLQHATWINVQIMERFKEAGIDFALPTQTLHLAGDDKRPISIAGRCDSKEATLSPHAVGADSVASGAVASNAVRPQPRATPSRIHIVESELTNGRMEDSAM